jgi:protease I
MSNIAVIIGPDFEDIEYIKPAEGFRNKGHELVHVGLKAGQTVRGKREGTEVEIDKSVKDASPSQFDALLIPGGYSPDNLRVDDDAVRFTREFAESGKPIFAICHAAQLLITAQVVKGRKLTGWKSIVQDIKNSGARYEDKEVVEDGNWVSSRGPRDIPAFIEASLKHLE